MSKKPKIALITTGGTIAMAATEDNNKAVFKHNGEHLLQMIPQISEIADVVTIDLFAVPSHTLTIADFNFLLTKIIELSSSVDGIVITHGTDVLEESAFALSILLDIEMPVVLTGAMRRADLPGADGPHNLLNAIQVAASDAARNLGVLVVMNGEIFSGFYTKKSHSFLPNAFSGNSIGWIAENRVRIIYKPIIVRPPMRLGTQRPIIITIEHGFDNSADDLVAIDYKKIDAAIFSIMGVGHTSRNIVDKMGEIAKVIPTIFCSRTAAGETFREYYGSPGTEGDLIKRGLIPSGFLNSRQARMLILLAFSNGNLGHHEVERLFSYFH